MVLDHVVSFFIAHDFFGRAFMCKLSPASRSISKVQKCFEGLLDKIGVSTKTFWQPMQKSQSLCRSARPFLAKGLIPLSRNACPLTGINVLGWASIKVRAGLGLEINVARCILLLIETAASVATLRRSPR